MQRRARRYIAGLLYYVIQCGNNREACFVETEDASSIWNSGGEQGNGTRCRCMHTV